MLSQFKTLKYKVGFCIARQYSQDCWKLSRVTNYCENTMYHIANHVMLSQNIMKDMLTYIGTIEKCEDATTYIDHNLHLPYQCIYKHR